MGGIKRGVIVGINDYRDDSIEKLSGAVNDATEVREILSHTGQFKIEDKHFLTNKEATCRGIRAAISNLFWDSEECDIALFFFSGHGRRDHLEQGYLLPYDADYSSPFVNGIGIQELKQLFLAARPKASCIMLLDCCYSGIAAAGDRGASEDAEAAKHFIEDLSLSDLKSSGQGRYIFAASGAERKAREMNFSHFGGDKHPHGVFSFHLIEALRSGLKGDFGQTSLAALRSHLTNILPEDHKPCFCANDEKGADRIILAVAEEEMLAHITKKLATIEDCLKDKKPRDVMTAIRLLHELDSLGRTIEQIAPHVETIDALLSEWEGDVYSWWFENYPLIRELTGRSELQDSLTEITNHFDRATLCGLPDTTKQLLAYVLEEAEKDDTNRENKGYQRIANAILKLERKPRLERGAAVTTAAKIDVKSLRATPLSQD